MSNYLTFDRQDIGQIAIEEAISCLDRVHEKPFIWKYAIISIHNALQCYLAMALRGSNGVATWKKRDAKKWLQAWENGEELPNVQLDFFMDLYDKLFKDKDSEERWLIDWLNASRNEFVHFVSDSFSVCTDTMLAACEQALNDIERTPFLSSGIFFYYDEQTEIFMESCNRLRSSIDSVKLNNARQ